MVCLVNKERTKRGLSPLGLNDLLTAAAQGHSNDQARYRRMSHSGSDGSTPGQRADRQKYPWVAVGENVAYGYDDEEQVMVAWMNSQGHKENILNPKYFEFGSAVSYNKDVPYYSQEFGSTGKPSKNIPKCGDYDEGNEDNKEDNKEDDRRRENKGSRREAERKRAEQEKKRKAEEEARKKAEEEARKKAEEEARRKAEEGRRRWRKVIRKKTDEPKKKEEESKKNEKSKYVKKDPRWGNDGGSDSTRTPQGKLHKECKFVDEAGYTFPLDYFEKKDIKKKGCSS